MNAESILSGALSGGIITAVWNLYNRRNEYDYEHKMYILKKRQKAYEQIELLLLRLQVRNIDAADNLAFHNIFCDPKKHTENGLAEFNSDLNDLMGNSVWISDDLIKHISTINAIINVALLELPEVFDYAKSVIIGKELKGKIELARIELFHQYLKDMKNLKNINSFLRKKSLM